jgi:hypothetical protein
MNLLFAILSLIFYSKAPEYMLSLEKVDNKVEVLVNDSLVYSTGVMEGNKELGLKVKLNPWLAPGENQIKVRLYNGSDVLIEQRDKHWEVRYELYRDDEPIDYIWEKGDDFKIGLTFEKSYQIEL